MLKELTDAVFIQVNTLPMTTINSFAGTGRSRTRSKETWRQIASRIQEKALIPYRFMKGEEPATDFDVHQTIYVALFDIDEEDARRWSDRKDGELARFEGSRDIAQALIRSFTIEKRELIIGEGGVHCFSNNRYE